jgi:hypothetical protein
MTIWHWLQENTLTFFGLLIVFFLLARNKFPKIEGWQAFLDSFESKGGQLLLLWITDLIFVAVLIRYWKNFDPTVQTTVVGILSAVNGAFLGAVGARPTTNGGNGNGHAPVLPLPQMQAIPPSSQQISPAPAPTEEKKS